MEIDVELVEDLRVVFTVANAHHNIELLVFDIVWFAERAEKDFDLVLEQNGELLQN